MQHRDIESKEQRILREESRGKFMRKLEKVVTTEGFEYYVDRSSGSDGGDDCLFLSDLDYEENEDEETELPPELFECTQETSFRDAPLMAPEFSSLVGGGEVDMREIESTHRIFAESPAAVSLRAILNEEIGNVIE